MTFVILVIALLAVSVTWLGIRAFVNRSYIKGRYRRTPQPDGHIAAEEAVYAEQMKIRYEYYQSVRDNPPEIPRVGDTVLASDDFAAAQSVIDAFKATTPEKPLGALVVLRDFNYRSVWFLHGLSDIVKAAIFDESQGKTTYLPAYNVLVVRAGDVAGLAQELSRP